MLKHLKADPRLRYIPVIVISIVEKEEMRMNLGASSYLIKPVDRDQLSLLVEQYRSSAVEAYRRGWDSHSCATDELLTLRRNEPIVGPTICLKSS